MYIQYNGIYQTNKKTEGCQIAVYLFKVPIDKKNSFKYKFNW